MREITWTDDGPPELGDDPVREHIAELALTLARRHVAEANTEGLPPGSDVDREAGAILRSIAGELDGLGQ